MLRRPRRNRRSAAIRGLAEETYLTPRHLVQPLFLAEGEGVREPIASLPGSFRFSTDEALREIEECRGLGLHNFILFPKIPDKYKDKRGDYGFHPDNFYLEAARRIKAEFPEVTLISDVALDPYSIDGHDGVVYEGEILNDETLHVLQKIALAQAEAGFDILGPSDMMDGRVEALRIVLEENGFSNTGIMSYTAKYASAFYGPFRDALDSAPVEGEDIPKDKKTYQMNPANRREALVEGELDTLEGADFLMVKPALHYLDVIWSMKQHFELPIAAYHVSGECAMLLAACQKGWLDYEQAMPETLLSLHRAGADVIITYLAKDFAKQHMA